MFQGSGRLPSPSEAAAEYPTEGAAETAGAATRSTPGAKPRATGPSTQGCHTCKPLNISEQ